MVNSLRKICFHLSKEEYCMVSICERIVEGGNRGSVGRPTDGEKREKLVIVDMVEPDESGEAGYYDI